MRELKVKEVNRAELLRSRALERETQRTRVRGRGRGR